MVPTFNSNKIYIQGTLYGCTPLVVGIDNETFGVQVDTRIALSRKPTRIIESLRTSDVLTVDDTRKSKFHLITLEWSDGNFANVCLKDHLESLYNSAKPFFFAFDDQFSFLDTPLTTTDNIKYYLPTYPVAYNSTYADNVEVYDYLLTVKIGVHSPNYYGLSYYVSNDTGTIVFSGAVPAGLEVTATYKWGVYCRIHQFQYQNATTIARDQYVVHLSIEQLKNTHEVSVWADRPALSDCRECYGLTADTDSNADGTVDWDTACVGTNFPNVPQNVSSAGTIPWTWSTGTEHTAIDANKVNASSSMNFQTKTSILKLTGGVLNGLPPDAEIISIKGIMSVVTPTDSPAFVFDQENSVFSRHNIRYDTLRVDIFNSKFRFYNTKVDFDLATNAEIIKTQILEPELLYTTIKASDLLAGPITCEIEFTADDTATPTTYSNTSNWTIGYSSTQSGSLGGSIGAGWTRSIFGAVNIRNDVWSNHWTYTYIGALPVPRKLYHRTLVSTNGFYNPVSLATPGYFTGRGYISVNMLNNFVNTKNVWMHDGGMAGDPGYNDGPFPNCTYDFGYYANGPSVTYPTQPSSAESVGGCQWAYMGGNPIYHLDYDMKLDIVNLTNNASAMNEATSSALYQPALRAIGVDYAGLQVCYKIPKDKELDPIESEIVSVVIPLASTSTLTSTTGTIVKEYTYTDFSGVDDSAYTCGIELTKFDTISDNPVSIDLANTTAKSRLKWTSAGSYTWTELSKVAQNSKWTDHATLGFLSGSTTDKTFGGLYDYYNASGGYNDLSKTAILSHGGLNLKNTYDFSTELALIYTAGKYALTYTVSGTGAYNATNATFGTTGGYSSTPGGTLTFSGASSSGSLNMSNTTELIVTITDGTLTKPDYVDVTVTPTQFISYTATGTSTVYDGFQYVFNNTTNPATVTNSYVVRVPIGNDRVGRYLINQSISADLTSCTAISAKTGVTAAVGTQSTLPDISTVELTLHTIKPSQTYKYAYKNSSLTGFNGTLAGLYRTPSGAVTLNDLSTPLETVVIPDEALVFEYVVSFYVRKIGAGTAGNIDVMIRDTYNGNDSPVTTLPGSTITAAWTKYEGIYASSSGTGLDFATQPPDLYITTDTTSGKPQLEFKSIRTAARYHNPQ